MAENLRGLHGVYRDFYGTDKPMPSDDQLMDILMGDKTVDLMKQLDSRLQQAGARPVSSTLTSGTSTSQRKTAGQKPVQAVEDPKTVVAAPEPEPEPEPETSAMEELQALVGLANIKHDVAELTALAKIKKIREDRGMKTPPVSLHLVFSGNPGTGKTTVARLLARIYKEIGVLSQGQLVEVDRSGLVAGYVGQTAVKTQEVIQKAMGGILFVDEAYALSQKDDPFGQESIDTILKAMEDHRDDFIVIVAGYTEPMKKFIDSNPGLQSRFNKYFEFPDYTAGELQQIFVQQCERYQYTLSDEAREKVFAMIAAMEANKGPNFANARSVRNLFESVITNQATRVSAIEEPTEEQLMAILPEDADDIALPCDEKRATIEEISAEETQQAYEGLIESLTALATQTKEDE